MSIKKLNESLESILEELRLMDPADEYLQLGDAYIVDTKYELLQALDNLIIGDSIAIKQGNTEITINFEDENQYSFILDAGILDNDRSGDNNKVWNNLSKQEVMDLINIEVR